MVRDDQQGARILLRVGDELGIEAFDTGEEAPDRVVR